MASNEGGSPAKRPRLNFRDNIEVLVGEGREKFLVHTDIICGRSSFFKAAHERWEKEKEPILLTDDSVHTFELYLQCLYTNKIAPVERLAEGYELLMDVYILADKLGDLHSANLIIDEIVHVSNKAQDLPGPPASVSHALSATPENSPLRRLLVDYYVHEIDDSDFGALFHKISPETLFAIAKELKRLKRKRYSKAHCRPGDIYEKKVSEMPKCYYHQHDESCPRCW